MSTKHLFLTLLAAFSLAFACQKPEANLSLPSIEINLTEAAVAVWDKGRAEQLWMEAPRWSKWSSVNSGDSFKEKAAAFPDCLTNAESRMKLLRVEHNRWWTERLLSGWKPCEKPSEKARQKELKASYMHWDMVPFDQLDEFTQDLDGVCIAAMAACGFVEAKL